MYFMDLISNRTYNIFYSQLKDKTLKTKAYKKTLEDLGFASWNEVHFRDISKEVFIGTFLNNVKELK